jgi:hypothetical protein
LQKQEQSQDKVSTNQYPFTIVGWIATMSIFIVKNYASEDLWPISCLADIPVPYLSLLHSLGNMVFAGSIITTTVMEWTVTDSDDLNIIPFWFDRVQKVERFLVLPALFLSIVSGIIRANVTYGTIQGSPLHVKSSLHLLATFGLWWGITDRTTINKVLSSSSGTSSCDNAADASNDMSQTTATVSTADADDNLTDNSHPSVIQKKIVTIRRISNLVSCGFLVASYAIMILKPGFTIK